MEYPGITPHISPLTWLEMPREAVTLRDASDDVNAGHQPAAALPENGAGRGPAAQVPPALTGRALDTCHPPLIGLPPRAASVGSAARSLFRVAPQRDRPGPLDRPQTIGPRPICDIFAGTPGAPPCPAPFLMGR